jgi:hypothetical protein
MFVYAFAKAKDKTEDAKQLAKAVFMKNARRYGRYLIADLEDPDLKIAKDAYKDKIAEYEKIKKALAKN